MTQKYPTWTNAQALFLIFAFDASYIEKVVNLIAKETLTDVKHMQ